CEAAGSACTTPATPAAPPAAQRARWRLRSSAAMSILFGVVCAAIASALFSGGAVQALDARAAPVEQHLRPTLLWRLAQRRRWLAGTGMTILGSPFQIAAFALAPVVVVQPALAIGLLVLMAA